MTDKLDAKDLSLSLLIARASLRHGRKLSTETGDSLNKSVGALAILNQAQMLVGIDNKMARRLLEKANSQQS
jgi:hypothetical protein